MSRLNAPACAAAVLLTASALWALSPAQAEDPLSLCGRTAASATQLYFDIARLPSTQILRGTDAEVVVSDGASGILWTFVDKPVTLVLCRPEAEPGKIESTCRGDQALCAGLLDKLRGDPRAVP